jgi:hypothetical protein
MKSIIKLSLSLAFCFYPLLVQIHAQKASLPNLLIGEWTMSGQHKPQVNDTITLTKKLLNEIDHPRWIFSESNKLEKRYTFKEDINGQVVVNATNSFFKWYYDNNTNLLRILDDKYDQYFKINSENENIMELICVK